MSYDALDDFAGPGGWDVGAEMLGLKLYGVDSDKAACDTAVTAGFKREKADVTEHKSPKNLRGKGYISSPSCTLFSMAGSGIGRLVLDILVAATKKILTGSDPTTVRDMARGAIYPVVLTEAEAKNAKRKPEKRWTQDKVEAKARQDAKIAALVLEPARRIIELEPEWLAFEQVPEVLPVWRAYQTVLSNQGWSVWTGVMNAADYGVPQTRKRAILIASRTRKVSPPTPTHAENPQGDDLFGNSLKKWVSMAEALGWGWDDEPSCTVSSGGAATGGAEPFANADYRKRLSQYVLRHNQASPDRPRDPETGKRHVRKEDGTDHYFRFPMDKPAPVITTKASAWAWERPATTIVGSFKPDVVAAPGYRTDISRQNAPGSVSVSVSEAGVLQSFPRAFAWQGSTSKQYEQAGNAIPPLLAAHVLSAATGVPFVSEAAA